MSGFGKSDAGIGKSGRRDSADRFKSCVCVSVDHLHSTRLAAVVERPGGKQMFGVNWSDPQTLWLNLTNLALGIVTLLAVAVVVGAVAWELVAKRRRAAASAAVDRELHAIVDEMSPHMLPVPELGLTMADGGVPVKPAAANEPKPARK
jgi:hypothetical protein